MTETPTGAVAEMAAILDGLPQHSRPVDQATEPHRLHGGHEFYYDCPVCSRNTTELATALSAAGYRIVKDDGDDNHLIDFGAHGWTIKHPLSCRPNLFDCPVNRAAEQQIDGEPAQGPGRYIVTVRDDGLLCLEDQP